MSDQTAKCTMYHVTMVSTYRTIALFFCCTTSSSRSFTAITRFVQWLRASFNTFCEGMMRTKSQRQVPTKVPTASTCPRISCSASRWRRSLSAFSFQPAGGPKVVSSKGAPNRGSALTYWKIAFPPYPCSTPATASPWPAPPPCPPIFSRPVSS